MAVGDYGPEWLIDFMSYRGNQFSHSHQSRDVRQLSLCLVQRILRVFPVVNVVNQAVPTGDAAFLVTQRFRAGLKPSVCAIPAPQAELGIVRLTTGDRLE